MGLNDELYPMYHCKSCGWFFNDRPGTVKEGLHGQQSEVIDIACEACRIEAELPEIPDTGTVTIMISGRGKMTNEELITELTDAAHATGYYLGKEGCKKLYDEARARLKKARCAIFERLVPIERLRQQISSLEDEVDVLRKTNKLLCAANLKAEELTR